MQRTDIVAVAPRCVEAVGDLQGVGVGLDDGVQFRAAKVQRFDASEVQHGQIACGPTAGTHALAEFIQAQLVEFERFHAGARLSVCNVAGAR